MMRLNHESTKIGVIGLGYVGLPLAVEFSRIFDVVGYDVNSDRVGELRENFDRTGELAIEDFEARNIVFTENSKHLASCNVFIVTVPTPIDRYNNPDLTALSSASAMVGSILKKGDLVIFESTVYPGATEEHCVPIIESTSGFFLNKDFYVGYSPERINPGDKTHTLRDIIKVTSGSTPEVAQAVTELYSRIIHAGTHNAGSIKIAEAAKVIENTQRDLNIALINELAIIFNYLDIDTERVLNAAGTKWNFLPFRPGLVGGHCIGVDPYYLTHKAQELGYHPEVILSGRKINDAMGNYVANVLVKALLDKGISPLNARVLILGFTFKENCPDTRNTKVVDVIEGLRQFSVLPEVYDPYVAPDQREEIQKQYMVDTISWVDSVAEGRYAGVVVAVAHDEFRLMGINKIRKFCQSGGLIMDIKYLFAESDVDLRI